jgi:MFS family permease
MNTLKSVDHSTLATNQTVVILLLVAAFVLNLPLLVGLVAVFMLVGTFIGKPGFGWIYTRILRPAGLLKADVLQDNPEPHRFAQGFGGTVVLASLAALLTGLTPLGWALAWLVVALAALNLFAGFCAGCAVYYWLNRLNVPGFAKSPPGGRFPGLRPRRTELHYGSDSK